jgi:hypothetical protein
MESRNLGAVAKHSRLVPMPDGTNLEIQQLHLGDWATLEEEAVQGAKRNLIETYTKNIDLIPQAHREEMLRDAFRRAEELRADNLPSVKVKMKVDGVEQDVSVGYASWWVANTVRGKLVAVWLAVRKAQPGITYDDAGRLFSAGREKALEDVANAVGELSKGTLGNADAPPDGALVA